PSPRRISIRRSPMDGPRRACRTSAEFRWCRRTGSCSTPISRAARTGRSLPAISTRSVRPMRLRLPRAGRPRSNEREQLAMLHRSRPCPLILAVGFQQPLYAQIEKGGATVDPDPKGVLNQAPSDNAPAIPEGPLRVCADPSSLPQSNERGEGYENKIAE